MHHPFHAATNSCALDTSIVNDRFAVAPGSRFASILEDYISKELASAEDDDIRLLADQQHCGQEKWLALCLRHMRRKLLAEWSTT